MAPTDKAYNVDWVFSNTSNVHCANHKGWFTTYTPFETSVGSIMSNHQTKVLGIGDIELDVKLTTGATANPEDQTKLVLHDVLYAPSLMSNIVGLEPHGLYGKYTGALCARFNTPQLWKLWLVGQLKGLTSFEPNHSNYINALWKDTECARFVVHTVSNKRDEPALTDKEQAWMFKIYHDKHNFMRAYGWMVQDEDSRGESRALVPLLIADDARVRKDPEMEPVNCVISIAQLFGR